MSVLQTTIFYTPSETRVGVHTHTHTHTHTQCFSENNFKKILHPVFLQRSAGFLFPSRYIFNSNRSAWCTNCRGWFTGWHARFTGCLNRCAGSRSWFTGYLIRFTRCRVPFTGRLSLFTRCLILYTGNDSLYTSFFIFNPKTNILLTNP